MPELVQIRDLVRRHGSSAFTLEVPTWDVPEGLVVGVVGPNGAGKTTLLRLLPGLDRPSSGSVRVLGLDPWSDTAAVRAQVGFASDDQALFQLRVHALLRFLSGYYPSWDPARVNALLERFEVDSSRQVAELSMGETTRLRLVLAMAHRPRLLVLDEPATGLDLGGRRALLRSVLDVVREDGCSVVVSSHQIADLERIADRLLVLRRGKVIFEGSVPDLVPEGRTLEEVLLERGAA